MHARSYRHMSVEERETMSLGLAGGHSLDDGEGVGMRAQPREP